MKKHLIIFAIIAVTFIACEEPITFTEPQPAEYKSAKKFPKKITGKYISTEDSSTLVIKEHSIVRKYDFTIKIHSNQLDSNIIRVGDSIIDLKTNNRFVIISEADSITCRLHVKDTLFLISDENVLKKYQGFYFLNLKKGDQRWEVKQLKKYKNGVKISSINSKEDLDKLKAITATQPDSLLPITFTINKQQFKEFLKQGGFAEEETFLKVKKK
jgi:hypothetical protein